MRLPRKRKDATLVERVRHLIAIDASNVVRRLKARTDEMISLFSRLRDRAPMLETSRSWFSTITFTELSLLDPIEQQAINEFYAALDELRWYMQYTEDMPTQVEQRTVQLIRTLEERHRTLTAAIGHPDAGGAKVVMAEVVSKKVARR